MSHHRERCHGIHVSRTDYRGARVIQGPDLFFYINPSFKNNIDSVQGWRPCYPNHLTLSCHIRKCPQPLNTTPLRTKLSVHGFRDHTQNNTWSAHVSKHLTLIYSVTPFPPFIFSSFTFSDVFPGACLDFGHAKRTLFH